MDSRIGFYNETGKRVLPEKTIGGRDVVRPVESTLGLDDAGKYFVVLDSQRVRGFNDILATLKAEVAALNPPAVEFQDVPEAAVLPTLDALAADELSVSGMAQPAPVKRGRSNAG